MCYYIDGLSSIKQFGNTYIFFIYLTLAITYRGRTLVNSLTTKILIIIEQTKWTLKTRQLSKVDNNLSLEREKNIWCTNIDPVENRTVYKSINGHSNILNYLLKFISAKCLINC